MSTAAKTSSKKTSAAKTVEPVAAAPVAKAAAPAPAKKAEKAAAPVAKAAAPVVAAPVAAPASPAKVEEDVSATLLKSIADLQEQVSALKSAIPAISTALKGIEKQAARVVKKAERRRKRKTDSNGEAKPTHFKVPVKITDELTSFLGLPKGSLLSRGDGTKGVIAYARSHSLMDKQSIKADAALRKLLLLNEGDSLTILNLQRYMKHLYIKETPVAA